MAQSGALAAYDLSSLEVVQNGGARLAPELRRRLREQLGCTPQEIYGTAEGLINMTRLDDPDELLLESSGAPVCDEDEIMVIDDAGGEVPDGEPGELVTRGPYMIRGYYNAPDKNAEAFLPGGGAGWATSSAPGRYVYTEGRRKDTHSTAAAEKISREEIENLNIPSGPSASKSLARGPTPLRPVRAWSTLPGEKTLAFADLIASRAKRQIASFKLPERLESLPRKIRRPGLKDSQASIAPRRLSRGSRTSARRPRRFDPTNSLTQRGSHPTWSC